MLAAKKKIILCYKIFPSYKIRAVMHTVLQLEQGLMWTLLHCKSTSVFLLQNRVFAYKCAQTV